MTELVKFKDPPSFFGSPAFLVLEMPTEVMQLAKFALRV